MKGIALALALMTLVADAQTRVSKQSFGKTPDGAAINIYTLVNRSLEARITNFGGIVVSLKVPDKNGTPADVVLGYDSLDGYLTNPAYLGAIIGRYGNRIAGGKFTLDGKTYTIPQNNGSNALHGGTKGFNKAVWDAKEIPNGIELNYTSPDGDQGFPGNLKMTVRYTVTNTDLKIEYSATTDKDTVVNLTNHSYFNLKGQGNGDILQHQVKINAKRYTPVDANLIPTGELATVEGTPFDFPKLTAVGARINDDNEQLKLGKGYDHNFVLDGGGGKLAEAAEVYEPASGRLMEVWTDQPGVQFYTGNFLDGISGKEGKVYQQRFALCLETQHFPDSPNHPKFPSTELKPGHKYHSVTIYRFSAK